MNIISIKVGDSKWAEKMIGLLNRPVEVCSNEFRVRPIGICLCIFIAPFSYMSIGIKKKEKYI